MSIWDEQSEVDSEARAGHLARSDRDKVVFGATVTLLDEDEKKVRYQVVGQVEADATHGRISYNSPLGRALIGRQKGEDRRTQAGDRSFGHQHGHVEHIRIDLVEHRVLLRDAPTVDDAAYGDTMLFHALQNDTRVEGGAFNGGE